MAFFKVDKTTFPVDLEMFPSVGESFSRHSEIARSDLMGRKITLKLFTMADKS
jgi:hypothetical protein